MAKPFGAGPFVRCLRNLTGIDPGVARWQDQRVTGVARVDRVARAGGPRWRAGGRWSCKGMSCPPSRKGGVARREADGLPMSMHTWHEPSGA